MPKRVVKVYLSKVQLEMLEVICRKLGRDYSGFFEDLFMRYVESINLAKERVHGAAEISDCARANAA